MLPGVFSGMSTSLRVSFEQRGAGHVGQSSEEECSGLGGRRLVSVLGQRGSRCVWTMGWRGGGQIRKKARRSCRFSLEWTKNHCRALGKEVADVNWHGHPGDVITLVMWSEWSFWLWGWKQKLKCWGRGRETPGGFRYQPGARCDGDSGLGVVVKWRQMVGSWIYFEEATEFSDKLNVGNLKKKKGVKGGFWAEGLERREWPLRRWEGCDWKGSEEKIRSLVSEVPSLVGDSGRLSSGTGGTWARHGQRSLVWTGDVNVALCIISVYNKSAFPRRNGLSPSSWGNPYSFLVVLIRKCLVLWTCCFL